MENKNEVRFKKIDLPFEPEPNVARPYIKKNNNDIELKFAIKNLDWSEEFRSMIFKNCIKYRIGSPNEDGFYSYGIEENVKNDSIYYKKNFPNLEFNTFYEVQGIPWKETLPGKETVIVQNIDAEQLNFKHYVFFMKDGTFECLADKFEIVN